MEVIGRPAVVEGKRHRRRGLSARARPHTRQRHDRMSPAPDLIQVAGQLRPGDGIPRVAISVLPHVVVDEHARAAQAERNNRPATQAARFHFTSGRPERKRTKPTRKARFMARRKYPMSP